MLLPDRATSPGGLAAADATSDVEPTSGEPGVDVGAAAAATGAAAVATGTAASVDAAVAAGAGTGAGVDAGAPTAEEAMDVDDALGVVPVDVLGVVNVDELVAVASSLATRGGNTVAVLTAAAVVALAVAPAPGVASAAPAPKSLSAVTSALASS